MFHLRSEHLVGQLSTEGSDITSANSQSVHKSCLPFGARLLTVVAAVQDLRQVHVSCRPVQQIGTCEQAVSHMGIHTGHISSQLQELINSGDACVISNKSLITDVKSSVQPRKDAL